MCNILCCVIWCAIRQCELIGLCICCWGDIVVVVVIHRDIIIITSGDIWGWIHGIIIADIRRVCGHSGIVDGVVVCWDIVVCCWDIVVGWDIGVVWDIVVVWDVACWDIVVCCWDVVVGWNVGVDVVSCWVMRV